MNVSINDRLAKIAMNKSLVKEFYSSGDRIVYLDNNSEFQIQLFNPYTYTIGADISLNGNAMSNRIIIKPGQRIWLERYLDSPEKFLFSTYEVDDAPEVKAAIAKNGVVEVKFYKEKEKPVYQPIYINNIIEKTPYYNQHWYKNEITCLDGAVNFCCDSVKSIDAPTHLETSCAKGISASAASCATYDASLSTTKAYVDSVSTAKTLGFPDEKEETIETGRIEKGGYSHQQFTSVDIDFEYWPFKTETVKILPTSRKPITKNDLNKVYCCNCGRKLNTKFKFCPYCGVKIEY